MLNMAAHVDPSMDSIVESVCYFCLTALEVDFRAAWTPILTPLNRFVLNEIYMVGSSM